MSKYTRLSCCLLGLLLASHAASASLPEEPGPGVVCPENRVDMDGHAINSLSEYGNYDCLRNPGQRCGTRTPSPEEIRRMKTTDCDLSRTLIKAEYWPSYVITIPVAFHVITRADGVVGYLPDARIVRQIQVLNEDFAAALGAGGGNTRIRFVLHSIDRVANESWFFDRDELGYKEALGLDQNRYLNIYTLYSDRYLGYSYYPQRNAGQVVDGVVLRYSVVGGPGDGTAPYDHGHTATHEVGHYLGLLHTFEGNQCQNGYTVGDLIRDTNPENKAHYECEQTQSCGADDPIHNYMNYTTDACMNQFTAEQANRMVCAILTYRPAMVRDVYDLNLDGAVNALDQQALFDFLDGKMPALGCGPTCGDLNGDGQTDAVDAVLMARRLLLM